LGILEKVVGPATTVQAAAKKVALGHFFLFPSYTALFYGLLSVFEGKGLTEAKQKFEDTWWDIFVAGSAFWPAANMVNFMYCPPMYRVLYLNVAGLYWNAFLSYQNVRANAMEAIVKQE
jgi:protein Mpv17